MPANINKPKSGQEKDEVKVRDMKPVKDAKGGGGGSFKPVSGGGGGSNTQPVPPGNG